MPYTIKPLQIVKARRIGVSIRPSKRRRKKIDVYRKGKLVASIGGIRVTGIPYGDYATYIQSHGTAYATRKRLAYLKRHAKEPKIKHGSRTPSYYADKILW